MKTKRINIAVAILTVILTAIAMLGTAAKIALAAPYSPRSITVLNSTTRSSGSTGTAVDAQAGNVTLLLIDDTRVTLRWQGYYGNVTGTITLDDGQNFTLYDWGSPSPQGEIYASNGSSVTWANVFCLNLSEYNISKQRINISLLEQSYNMSANDRDGVNETFNYTFNGSFTVGTILINNESRCSATYTYVNDSSQASRFAEVLLTDNVSIIYTTVIEQNTLGFDARTYDFQMIVGENGDVAATTPYYFFVELT